MREVSRGRFKVKGILNGILERIHAPGNTGGPVFAPMAQHHTAG
jgi:hypothetical protein